MTTVDYSVLSGNRPKKSLLKKIPARSGRNSQGRITVRHQGGGNKKRYRVIDFMQQKYDVPARVESIEYDPYRTAFIALLKFADGQHAYIIAPHGLTVGMSVTAAEKAPLEIGNRMKMKHIPVGTQVHNVELEPAKGGQLGRSAGSSLQIMANADGYTDLKMPSSEVRRVPWDCFASIGQISNIEHSNVVIGKAGRSRWLGVRPTVRGKAMNPVDHPYGGGEGSQPRGTRKPKTAWGKVTGGHKTRNRRKWSTRMILARRKK
jgi:large subunit ribosomal protein L2